MTLLLLGPTRESILVLANQSYILIAKSYLPVSAGRNLRL